MMEFTINEQLRELTLIRARREAEFPQLLSQGDSIHEWLNVEIERLKDLRDGKFEDLELLNPTLSTR